MHTVISAFDDTKTAQRAVERLVDAGFARGDVHLQEPPSDDADYALKSAKLDGSNFTVSYESKTGPVTETYVYENNTLRLDKGSYGGMEATWHKQPMSKCS